MTPTCSIGTAVELAELLRSVRGMVVVSTYPSDMYDDLYHGWRRISRGALADGAGKREEVLLLNAAADRGTAQDRLW